jgi:hypothetical protein
MPLSTKTKLESHTLTAPASWACYLINGDASGFDYYNTPDDNAGDRDKAQCDAWADALAADNARVVSCDGEAEFSRYCDAMRVVPGLLPGDMLTYQILRDAPIYYSVHIQWSDKPTAWHPTEKTGPFSVLSSGSFASEEAAHSWAKENLAGQPYSVVEHTA